MRYILSRPTAGDLAKQTLFDVLTMSANPHLFRGAVRFISTSIFDVSPGNASTSDTLAALQAMHKVLHSNSDDVAAEVALALQSLVESHGSSMCIEWDSIISTLGKMDVWVFQ